MDSGTSIQIVDNGTTPTTGTEQPDGSILVETAGTGALTVTGTDDEGNVTVCTASSI